MATSELVSTIQPGDRLIIFRPTKDADGVTRYRAMRVGWDFVAGLFTAMEAATVRTETIAGKVVTAGAPVAVTFAKPFAAPPALVPLPGWSADQMVEASASAVTTTGATVLVKRSRGTLALSTGPFESAPAGTAFSMLAIGR